MSLTIHDAAKGLTLSPQELRSLSARQRPSAVLRWVERERIPYVAVDADGWPLVLRSTIAPKQPSEPELNFS